VTTPRASLHRPGYDPAVAHDPFPRERVGATMRRVPAYLRLAWRLTREPLLSRARRAAVIGAAGYLVSPVDLVPGFIPVLGQLDDIALAIAALKFALAGLSPEVRRRHLDAVGLADDLLMDDLRTLGVATAWLGRAGVRTTERAARKTGTVAVAGARVAGKATVRTASAAASRAVPAASSAAAKAGPAARGAAGRGIATLRGMAAKRPAMKVKVSIRRSPALGPCGTTGEELLPVEPDVIELPGPSASTPGDES